jgi:hypothetical protein
LARCVFTLGSIVGCTATGACILTVGRLFIRLPESPTIGVSVRCFVFFLGSTQAGCILGFFLSAFRIRLSRRLLASAIGFSAFRLSQWRTGDTS